MTEQLVTPWSVSGKIDYMRLVENFGTQLIGDDLKERFEKIIGRKLHPWIARCLFFSHRELDKFLDAYENGESVFLYTGRGPSNNLHLGHMIPFIMTQWLQQVFDCPTIIQIADDEKYYFKDIEFKDIKKMEYENVKDIISFGFDPKKTFIFSNREYRLGVPEYELFVSDMKKKVSTKEVTKIFGFDDDTNIGMLDWPFYQTAAAFSKSYPHIFGNYTAHCMVVYAIDQDNYFRLGRNMASEMNLIKPYSIMSTFLDPLTGAGGKMSSTGSSNDITIFLSDNSETIKKKIITHAYSGGGGNGTLNDHKKFGGNIDIDIPCRFLKYFEYNDDILDDVYNGFKSGTLSCSDTKNILINTLTKIIQDHQHKRNDVTDDMIMDFYKKKDLGVPKSLAKDMTNEEEIIHEILDCHNIEYFTLYHDPVENNDDRKIASKRVNGIMTNNLLLYNGDQYYLFVTDCTKQIDTRILKKETNLKALRFVPKKEYPFDICPPSLSIFSFARNKINMIIDKSIMKESFVGVHPMHNDRTIYMSPENLVKIIGYMDHNISMVSL